MNESAITVRYAKAFFAVALEQDIISELKDDMELVMNLCWESDEFLVLLKSPVIKISEKIRLFNIIFKERVNELTLNFLLLILQNKREIFLPDISRNILTLIREEKGIKSVVLTTAAPVDDVVTKKILVILENELKGKVELSSRIKPDIIGGIILRVDDRQYDASVVTQLKKIKQELLTAQL
jgi:F-type H+-transporting ATPase subunit delta